MPRNEARQHPRIRTLVPATAIHEGKSIDAVLLNVGHGGAFVLDDARLAGAEAISMTFDLSEHGVVPVVARVVRRQQVAPRCLDVPGLGVQFIDLTPGAAAALERFVTRLPLPLAA